MAAERVDGAENPQENLLREVEGFVVVVEQVERQLIDHPLVLADELGAGVFIARRATLDERGFPAADVCPGNRANGFHGELSAHSNTCPLDP